MTFDVPTTMLMKGFSISNFKLHKIGVNKDVSSDESLSHSVTLVPAFVRTFGYGEQWKRVKCVSA